MTPTSPTNPYEPPREAVPQSVPDFSDRDAELVDLRRRVEELEKGLRRSWLLHPNMFLRMATAVGYAVLGYAVIVGSVFLIMFLFWLASGVWPS